MFKKINKNEVRRAKHTRIRYTLSGTADMPRLNVYRSINEIGLYRLQRLFYRLIHLGLLADKFSILKIVNLH